MPGYYDTKKMIEDTLVGRPPGTLIYPDGHQDFALALLDYIRSVELLGASSLQGIAEQNTYPVQPNSARVSYIATVPPNRSYVFENFKGEDGQPIQVVSGIDTLTFCTLLWNCEYWTVQTSRIYSGDGPSQQIGIRGLLSDGFNIGTLTIDGIDYTIKSPTVAIRNLLTEGTTIGILTINGTDYTLRAPTSGGGGGGASGDYILGNQLTPSATQGTLMGMTGWSRLLASAVGDKSKVEWDSENEAWHFYGNIYADGFNSAGGIGSEGGGGVSYLKQLTDVYHNDSGVLRADGTAVQDGDALVYDATNVRWTAAVVGGGGGGGSVTIVNDLTTGGTTSALSAEMGKTLKSYIDAGYVFKGIATPETNPGAQSTNYPVCYIAVESGSYVDFFGGPQLTLGSGQFAFFKRAKNQPIWDITTYTLNVSGGGGGGSSTLSGLSDVSISGSLSNGNYLTYNSSLAKWVNSVPPSIATLFDVRISSVQSGQVLAFDGSHWVNAIPGGGGGGGSTVSWGTESNNTVPLTVDGTTKTLLLSSALTGYATQSWVENKGYLTSFNETDPTVPSWAKQTNLQFSALPNLYIGTTVVQSSSASQALTGISSIKLSSNDSLFEWDSENEAWRFHGNLYADGWMSGGGIGSTGGGVDLNRVWESLTNNTDKPDVKINIAHIPNITTSKITDLESWISGKGYITSSSLSGYATQTWVENKGYLTSSALTGYATQTWVENKGYLTSSALTGYATESWVNGKGYATETWVENKGYLTSESDPTVPSWAKDTHLAFASLPAIYILGTQAAASAAHGTLLGVSALSNGLSSAAGSDNSRIEWDAQNNAWHIYGNIYADGYSVAGGIQ